MPSCTTIADLARLLADHGVAIECWRHPDANTVDDLYRELMRGECRLLDGPLRRELAIVRIWIRRREQVLIEAEVIETPGRSQLRSRLPSEKMLPGESPEAAAKRGVYEELACADERIAVVRAVGPIFETRSSAPTYPGLRSDYLIHDVECTVAGLPDGAFETQEDDREHSGKMITHRWVWGDSTQAS